MNILFTVTLNYAVKKNQKQKTRKLGGVQYLTNRGYPKAVLKYEGNLSQLS